MSAWLEASIEYYISIDLSFLVYVLLNFAPNTEANGIVILYVK